MDVKNERTLHNKTITELSQRYGLRYVYQNSRRIASTIAIYYDYDTSMAEQSPPLSVRVYNRTKKEMNTIPFSDVLALIPVQPPEMGETKFGQVILSDTVYISTTIYIYITAVLATLDVVMGT